MFGKKSGNSRQAINSILTSTAKPQPEEDKSDLFWLDQTRLPPVDYAQTVSARSAHGWQVAAQLKAIALLPRLSGVAKGEKEEAESPPRIDGKESPVDVEMSSKPPSRESSFRGDDVETTSSVEGAGSGSGTSATQVETTSPVGAQGPAAPVVKTENIGGTSCETSGSGTRSTAAAARVDSKKRVYGCTVPDCGKVYTKSSHLKSHMRSHTGKNLSTIEQLFDLFWQNILQSISSSLKKAGKGLQ